MLDIAVAYDRYKFLGNEFLTWLWYALDNAPQALQSIDPTMTALEVGNRIVLKNQTENGDETISIKGDVAGLEEGLLALAKGAMVTEINLIYKTEEHQWQFSLKGESLGFTSLKTPETGNIETQDDIEGMVRDSVGEGIDVEILVAAEPTHLAPDPLFLDVAQKHAGESITLVRASGGSDARFIAHGGMPVILSRPRVGNLHGLDEWIDIGSMSRFYQVCEEDVLRKLLS